MLSEEKGKRLSNRKRRREAGGTAETNSRLRRCERKGHGSRRHGCRSRGTAAHINGLVTVNQGANETLATIGRCSGKWIESVLYLFSVILQRELLKASGQPVWSENPGVNRVRRAISCSGHGAEIQSKKNPTRYFCCCCCCSVEGTGGTRIIFKGNSSQQKRGSSKQQAANKRTSEAPLDRAKGEEQAC